MFKDIYLKFKNSIKNIINANNNINDINKKSIYIVLITISSLIIIISIVIIISTLQNHEYQKKLANRKIHKMKKISSFNLINKSKRDIEGNLILQEKQELGIISDAQKENDKYKYNKNIQKELDDIFNSDEKVVYLSFDDGPSKMTIKILDILKEENVPATFFMLGTNIEYREEIVKRAYNEGHTIGNHGYSHIYGKIYKSPRALLSEYIQTENEFKKILGKAFNTNLIRFPGGSFGGYYEKTKKKSREVFEGNKIGYIDWNTLTNDAAGTDKTKEQIKVFNSTRKGKKALVVLQHDTVLNKELPKTLREIIKILKKEGYTFKNFNNHLLKEI